MYVSQLKAPASLRQRDSTTLLVNNPKRLYCYVPPHCVLLIFPRLERKAVSILHPKQQEENTVYTRLDRHSCHPNAQKIKSEGLTEVCVQLVNSRTVRDT